MEKITESLEMLYGSSGTPFFLSDEFGNIKWKNTACGETIVFPKGINCDILTEQINIDGKEYSAQGTSFADGDERFILWRVNTLTDVLMQLGSTNTYADICYMLSQARSDVAKATQSCNEDNALNSIQRNIEVLSELATVIYRKTPPAPAIYFFEKLNKIIERANKEMSDIPIVFKLSTDKPIYEDIPVNISEKLLYVCMFSVLKAMGRCSDRNLFVLSVSVSDNNINISSSFSISADTHTGMIADDFEMYSAKLYIGYIGGKMSYNIKDSIGRLEIAIPTGDSSTLNSPLYAVPPETCEKLAGVFMRGIADKK